MRLFQLMFCDTIPAARCRAMGGFRVVGEPNIQRTVICTELSILITYLNSKATEILPDLKLWCKQRKMISNFSCVFKPAIDFCDRR